MPHTGSNHYGIAGYYDLMARGRLDNYNDEYNECLTQVPTISALLYITV